MMRANLMASVCIVRLDVIQLCLRACPYAVRDISVYRCGHTSRAGCSFMFDTDLHLFLLLVLLMNVLMSLVQLMNVLTVM